MDELRQSLADWAKQQRQPARTAQPNPPGYTGDEKHIEAARELYGRAILKKEPGQLTRDEINFLRAGIASAMAEDE